MPRGPAVVCCRGVPRWVYGCSPPSGPLVQEQLCEGWSMGRRAGQQGLVTRKSTERLPWQRVQITARPLSDHSGLRLEITQRNVSGKSSKTCKLNDALSNNPWLKKKWSRNRTVLSERKWKHSTRMVAVQPKNHLKENSQHRTFICKEKGLKPLTFSFYLKEPEKEDKLKQTE